MGKLPSRDETDVKNKWRLEDVYSDDRVWEQDFQAVKDLSGGGIPRPY